MEKVMASQESILGRRIGAFITDHVIITMVVMIPFFFNFNKIMDNPFAMFQLFSYMMIIGLAAYLLKDLFGGRSIGKVLFGLYVREYENSENTPAVHKLILRNVLIFLWPVELIAMLVDKENRRIGDKIGKTQVIGYSKKVIARVIIIAVFAFVLFVTCLFFGITQMIKNDDSYKAAVKYIESQNSITSITGNITGYGYFPNGSINISNGHGVAELIIEVKGEKQNLTVNIYLEKTNNSDWKVKDMKY